MSMKMKQIQAFIMVATEGNMTISANKLGITQSGLSRLLSSLEEDLKVSLFERHKHGVSLSEYGSAFLPHALTMINTESKARQELESINGAGKGIVRAGCVSSFLSSHYVNIINKFHMDYPEIHIKIVDRVDSELLKLLLTHEIDIALCGLLPHNDKLVTRGRINWQDNICIIARRDHPLHARNDLTFNDLLDYEWIMPPPTSTPMKVLAELFRRHNLPCPAPVIECASPSAIKSFICQSNLLTSMPAPIYRLEETMDMVRPLKIEQSVFVRDFYVYSHFGVLSGASLKFIQYLKQA